MMYRFAHKSLVRGTNSAERLSNKKIRASEETRCKGTKYLTIKELVKEFLTLFYEYLVEKFVYLE